MHLQFRWDKQYCCLKECVVTVLRMSRMGMILMDEVSVSVSILSVYYVLTSADQGLPISETHVKKSCSSSSPSSSRGLFKGTISLLPFCQHLNCALHCMRIPIICRVDANEYIYTMDASMKIHSMSLDENSFPHTEANSLLDESRTRLLLLR